MIIVGYDNLPVGRTIELIIWSAKLQSHIHTPVYIKRVATREEYDKQGSEPFDAAILKDPEAKYYEVLMD